MTSKVLFKLPTVSFSQGKKPRADLVAVPERNKTLSPVRHQQGMNVDRVAQLEQNMKFLQEQFQATLTALHQEVEALRQKNRDLQFQLVFSKGSSCVPSTPSSPEESELGLAKSKVELLEKELQDTKTSLQEAKTQNQYLSEIIEQQKKKFDLSEEQCKDKVGTTVVAVQVHSECCMKVARAMMLQLRRKNQDHERRIAELMADSANNSGSHRADQSWGSSGTSAPEQVPHKFPPLQSQSYWHRKLPRNGRNQHDRQGQNSETMIFTSWSQFQNGNARTGTGSKRPGYQNSAHTWKHRGQTSQRDRKDGEQQHQQQQQQQHQHRSNYKNRHSRDYQKESADSGESLRDAGYSGERLRDAGYSGGSKS